LSGRTAHRGITPINDLVAVPCPGHEHRDKAGHPRATGVNHELEEVPNHNAYEQTLSSE
jgi:hypothetical protein